MDEFSLHPQLARDCVLAGRFPLSMLLLLNDSQYPWFILVPQRHGIHEIHHLCEADQQQLLRESSALAAAIEAVFVPDKLNIAALGNMVPQLHVHHIARFRNDPAWPAPVWGKLPARPYALEALRMVVERLSAELVRTTVDGVSFSADDEAPLSGSQGL